MNLTMIQSCYFRDLAPVAGHHENLQVSIFGSPSKFQTSHSPFCSRVLLGFNSDTNPFVGKRQNFRSNCVSQTKLLSFSTTVKIPSTRNQYLEENGSFMGFKLRCSAKTLSFSSRTVSNGKKKKNYGGILPWILRSLENENDVEKTLELHYGKLNPKKLTVILKEQRSWEKALRVFEWVKSQEEYIPNVIHYNVVLRALGRARKWDQLRLCWIDMAKRGVRPTNNTYSMLVDVYGKAGLVKEALLWIKHMKLNGIHPDEVTMSTVLKVLKDGGEYDRADRFYKDWCAGRIELDDFSLDSMDGMKSNTGTEPISLKQFLLTELFRIGSKNKSSPGRRNSTGGGTSPRRKPYLTTTYNTLIDLYGKAGRLKDAADVFADMLSSGVALDTFTFNTMIFVCGSHGHLFEAELLLDKMEERRINPDTKTYNIFLSLYANAGNMDAALQCYRKIREVGLFPDEVTRRAILHLLSERNMVQEVDAIIEELEKSGMYFDEHSLPVVMKMYVNEGLNEKANVLLKKCRSTIKLSSKTYAAVIDLYANKGLWVEAESVFLGDRFGQKKEVEEYNVMIKAYGKAGLYDEAFSLFQNMKNHGTWPDECTYNSLIQMFAGSNDLGDRARDLLAEMQEIGLKPACQSFSAVIANFSRTERLSDATHILQEMSKVGVKPNEVVYGSLINGFAEAGNFDEAVHYFHEMEGFGIPVNQIILSTMIKAYTKLGSVIGANLVYEKMKQFEGGPDIVASNSMLNLYAELGLVSEAELLFDSLKQKGQADGVSFVTMIYVYKNMGMREEALSVATEMRTSGLLKDCSTFNKVMSCYATYGELVACVELLQEMIDRKLVFPDHGTFKVLFTVLKKGGFPIEAVRQLESSYQEGRTPYSGQAVITSVFSVFGFHRLALESCDILMNTEMMSPSCFAYNTALNAYGASGKLDEAFNIFMRMKDAGVEPDIVTYIHLVTCYGKAGIIEGINRIYGKLKYRVIEPNESLYNAVKAAYINVNRYELCELVDQEMRFSFDEEEEEEEEVSDSETEDETLSDAETSSEELLICP